MGILEKWVFRLEITGYEPSDSLMLAKVFYYIFKVSVSLHQLSFISFIQGISVWRGRKYLCDSTLGH